MAPIVCSYDTFLLRPIHTIKSAQIKIISLIAYCCITNSPKFSDIKQQLSDCGSRMWKGHSRTGLYPLCDVCGLTLKMLVSWAWRIPSQQGFFTHMAGSWAGLLQAGLSGAFNQGTYMWSLCVPWASRSVADRIQEGTFQEQGFQENQMEAVWPFLTFLEATQHHFCHTHGLKHSLAHTDSTGGVNERRVQGYVVIF